MTNKIKDSEITQKKKRTKKEGETRREKDLAESKIDKQTNQVERERQKRSTESNGGLILEHNLVLCTHHYLFPNIVRINVVGTINNFPENLILSNKNVYYVSLYQHSYKKNIVQHLQKDTDIEMSSFGLQMQNILCFNNKEFLVNR